MPEKIIQRKCFVINTAYILIAAMLVLLTILTAGLLMPFWIALFLSAMYSRLPIVKRKTGTKKERIINNRTIPILSAAVLYPYLWYSKSYKFVWRSISKFPRLL